MRPRTRTRAAALPAPCAIGPDPALPPVGHCARGAYHHQRNTTPMVGPLKLTLWTNLSDLKS